MENPQKLRKLAEWFDLRDEETGTLGNEVQCDLLEIAQKLEDLTEENSNLYRQYDALLEENTTCRRGLARAESAARGMYARLMLIGNSFEQQAIKLEYGWLEQELPSEP